MNLFDTVPHAPALSLDDLATSWLTRRMTELAAMPGLNNDLGAIQAVADIAAIRDPVFPPYSGGNEVTLLTFLNGKQLAQAVPHVEIRWRAYALERRCKSNGWALESRTTLLPNEPGVLVRVTVTNDHAETRKLSIGFLCSGRAASSGKEGYAWAVPSIPTDVFNFTKSQGLRQTVSDVGITDARCLTNEQGNAHAVHACWPAPTRWERQRIPTWETEVAPGGSFTLQLLVTFHSDRAEAQAIARRWYLQQERAFAEARARWEALWQAAFTPDNTLFSGHMPILVSSHDSLQRLYYNGILTIITCRRIYPEALVKPCYITLWPRRGEGSGYLSWELNCTSGVLARLDPDALRDLWLTLAAAPWLDSQVVNFFTGEHGGWVCCAQPQSLYTAAFHLMRWAGDDSFLNAAILRRPKKAKGFEAASQGQVVQAAETPPQTLTGREVLVQSLTVHRDHHLPDKATIDFGGREAYLECITTYAHGTAAQTALQAWALKEGERFLTENPAREIAALESAVHDLYDAEHGFFYCEYPDGSRHTAPNLYDLGLVLRAVGDRLPRAMVDQIARFARSELLTDTWAHCLWPGDLDIASGLRCDHQWCGSFSAWVPQFVLGLLDSGLGQSESDAWITDWLTNVAKVTAQGPFAQAYWADDMHPTEAGAAAKCFDELTQGNHWVIGSGTLFAEMVLDGVCGLSADLSGNLVLKTGLKLWSNDVRLFNIEAAGRRYHCVDRKLIPILAK